MDDPSYKAELCFLKTHAGCFNVQVNASILWMSNSTSALSRAFDLLFSSVKPEHFITPPRASQTKPVEEAYDSAQCCISVQVAF